ncbi:3-deoxy-D-manno-octulosonic acid transferase [Thioflexithrix psekupsensis]|uniref:3-deoxy-D-manno-octulosonic acid transferase n=2 Tax=Thioflexithrix psekupsensis TaxID=1570016 RepID=A0A251X6H5_9GAMM|nr:3-deoxy-D-manno-octulosonic acid transferase [Thioflexithrix psekupsensis]
MIFFRGFYTLLLHLLLPWILLRLLWRSRLDPEQRQRWQERFGLAPAYPCDGAPTLWIHAVSVGEVQAALPLITALMQHYPSHSLLITTTTLSGSKQLHRVLKNTVRHVYLPYDLPWSMRLFLQRQHPSLLLLIETELWPNLLYQCHAHHIPCFLLSARLSARSARRYGYFGGLTRELLQQLTHIAAQSQADAQRFLALGARQVTVTGNLKFDMSIPEHLPEQARLLRAQWGSRPIWIAASTHEGEETLLLTVHAQLLQQFPQLLLILVPRHPERFDRVAQLCQQKNFAYCRRSQTQSSPCHSDVSVYLADTMGELLLLYHMADIAVIGGSFIEHGGHNPLEPALAQVAIISGCSVFNFAAIYNELQQAQAVIFTKNTSELLSNVILLLSNAALRQQYAQRAYAYVLSQQGALARTLNVIQAAPVATDTTAKNARYF